MVTTQEGTIVPKEITSLFEAIAPIENYVIPNGGIYHVENPKQYNNKFYCFEDEDNIVLYTYKECLDSWDTIEVNGEHEPLLTPLEKELGLHSMLYFYERNESNKIKLEYDHDEYNIFLGSKLWFFVDTIDDHHIVIRWLKPSIETIANVIKFFHDYMKNHEYFWQLEFFTELTQAIENGLTKPTDGWSN
jgi:hypothetical protein